MVKINENMNQLGTVYATKRRRRNGKSLKPSPKESSGKSNPSKRHRERLNAELDTLASLLPYEASILSKLDRLSILRLSVSYLRTKSYFQVSLHKGKNELGHIHDNQFRNRDLTVFDSPSLDGECFLQALNGFLVILTSDGEVFFATHTIESYLGFHQSDVVHQSVYELVHSEDREELQRQLTWSSQIPTDSGLPLMDALRPENCLLLERSFTVRFRCLLDNTSGFLRLDIRGRIKVLHGQNRKTEEPPLALFAICTPFGPPSLLELPHKESMFKSKHRLDMALVSMDQRGKSLLGYSDAELTTVGGYDLVHYDDLAYVASAHQELLKTGASGLIAYRLQTKDSQWQWLQTSSRLVYKNSKPDFIISTHRPLMEEEGRDLLGKRTMDFKVSYLDAGLASSYINDQDSFSAGSASTAVPLGGASAGSNSSSGVSGASRLGRKYKNQLRDFLSNCRTKRRSGTPEYLPETPAWTPSAAAAAAAYSPSVYPTPMTATAAPYTTDNGFYVHHQQNLQTLPNLQTFYPTLDNRFLPADNLFHGYRGLGSCAGYYAAADYSPYVHAAASTNSFLAAGYDSTMGMTQLYSSPGASPADSSKYASSTAAIAAANRIAGHVSAGAVSSSGEAEHESSSTPTSSVDSGGYNRESRSNTRKSDHPHLVMNGIHHKGDHDIKTADTRSSAVTSSLVTHPGFTSANDTRQTVLMWGSSSVTSVTHGEPSMGPADISATPAVYGATGNGSDCHSEAKKYHHVYNGSLDLNLNNACKWGRVGSHYLYGAATAEAGTEVWPHPTQYYPYPTYHHHQAHHATVDPHHNHPHPSHPHHPSPASHSSSYTAIGRTGVLCCPSPR